MACSDSQYGVKLVEGHHHTKWENNDVHKTFEDRMEKIIEVCKVCYNIWFAKSLLMTALVIQGYV
jgi:hypothetical protein